jgi:hypothetical protein
VPQVEGSSCGKACRGALSRGSSPWHRWQAIAAGCASKALPAPPAPQSFLGVEGAYGSFVPSLPVYGLTLPLLDQLSVFVLLGFVA